MHKYIQAICTENTNADIQVHILFSLWIKVSSAPLCGCVGVYVCMYVCARMCTCMCVCVCLCVWFECMYVCICMSVYVCDMCMCLCKCVCTTLGAKLIKKRKKWTKHRIMLLNLVGSVLRFPLPFSLMHIAFLEENCSYVSDENFHTHNVFKSSQYVSHIYSDILFRISVISKRLQILILSDHTNFTDLSVVHSCYSSPFM